VKKILAHIAIFGMFILPSSCGVYSFTGASISPDVKTVSVAFFENVAPLINPNLSQVFTEKLKDIFIVQTNLTLTQKNGDLHFEGTITDYNIRPMNVQAGNQVAQNRLTISVRVTFTNRVEPKNDFEKTFTRFADFDANQSLSSVESDLVEQITEELTQDVFNESVVNW
jgi:hypothetical protein